MASNTHGKRKHNAIDLTGDDDGPSRRGPPGDSITQSQRDSWLEQSNEEDADDIVISSQDGDDTATASYQLYGAQLSKTLPSCKANVCDKVSWKRRLWACNTTLDTLALANMSSSGESLRILTIPTPCASRMCSGIKSAISRE